MHERGARGGRMGPLSYSLSLLLLDDRWHRSPRKKEEEKSRQPKHAQPPIRTQALFCSPIRPLGARDRLWVSSPLGRERKKRGRRVREKKRREREKKEKISFRRAANRRKAIEQENKQNQSTHAHLPASRPGRARTRRRPARRRGPPRGPRAWLRRATSRVQGEGVGSFLKGGRDKGEAFLK